MSNAPVLTKVKVRDLRPYYYGIWCRIEDGTPFANEIVVVKWQDDGKKVKLMLESHNFVTGLDPDEEIEVVELRVGDFHATRYHDWKLPPPPTPPVTVESLKSEIKATVQALDAANARITDLEQEVSDTENLVNRQASLLRDAVGVLRGPPPEDTLWSHHDVADLARQLVAERDAALAREARLREALEAVGSWVETEGRCWCSIPSMIPYRGHDGGCEAARAALSEPAAIVDEVLK